MHKSLLKGIDVQRSLPKQEAEDIKSDTEYELTNMDFVNKHRDFSKITDKDLDTVFLKLKNRCPKTWTNELQVRHTRFFYP